MPASSTTAPTFAARARWATSSTCPTTRPRPIRSRSPSRRSLRVTLDKSSVSGHYDHVGQILNYTYTLTNTGNVTLGGPLDITDDKATDAVVLRLDHRRRRLNHVQRHLRGHPGRSRCGLGHEHRDGQWHLRRRDDHLECRLGHDPGRPASGPQPQQVGHAAQLQPGRPDARLHLHSSRTPAT